MVELERDLTLGLVLLTVRVRIWLMSFARFCSFLQVEEESDIVCLLRFLREVSGFIYLLLSFCLMLLCLLIHLRILISFLSVEQDFQYNSRTAQTHKQGREVRLAL